ncbi:hypothetical protein [Arthrobacter roseus]|uniref:hypothetical protein n=1 Tax=Arthrobacter roseus TaxID=136274 RepID=UPI001965F31F|nr:hypothetical protein [Arthrobacter roseus]MBM7847897.1 putative phosphoribosyltransferase [Arthrobacter roseus]
MTFSVPLPSDLRAEGLHLRALEDTGWRLEYDLSRVPDVPRWTFYPVDIDEETARRRIVRSKERDRERVTARYAVIVDGVALGTAGMACVEDAEPEVLYVLSPKGGISARRIVVG